MLRQLFFCAACASAFLPNRPRCRPTPLRAETEDDNLVVDDAARASLEKLALMTRSSEADEGPPRPKSSGTARRRRAEEMKLVEVLGRTSEPEQFKAAIDGLWSLWFSERGSENRAKLEAVDRLISEGEACMAGNEEACVAYDADVEETAAWKLKLASDELAQTNSLAEKMTE